MWGSTVSIRISPHLLQIPRSYSYKKAFAVLFIKVRVFHDVTSCSLVDRYQCFGRTCYLHVNKIIVLFAKIKYHYIVLLPWYWHWKTDVLEGGKNLYQSHIVQQNVQYVLAWKTTRFSGVRGRIPTGSATPLSLPKVEVGVFSEMFVPFN
jgi:hypothetical protein